MRKRCFWFVPFLLSLPLLAACGGKYDYTRHISEIKYDIFRAETEEFSVTLSLSSREYPYADDGVACTRTNLAEISLVPAGGLSADFCVYVVQGESEWGGEASFRNVRGDYYYSQGVETFPEGSVSLRIEWESETRELVATSVKTADTISPEEALSFAVAHESEAIAKLTENGVFRGEFRVRLLRRDDTYYYVGIIDADGRTISLLLNSETGEVLARRESA